MHQFIVCLLKRAAPSWVPADRRGLCCWLLLLRRLIGAWEGDGQSGAVGNELCLRVLLPQDPEALWHGSRAAGRSSVPSCSTHSTHHPPPSPPPLLPAHNASCAAPPASAALSAVGFPAPTLAPSAQSTHCCCHLMSQQHDHCQPVPSPSVLRYIPPLMLWQQKVRRGGGANLCGAGECSRNKWVFAKSSLHLHAPFFPYKLLLPGCWAHSISTFSVWAADGHSAPSHVFEY